MGHDAPLVRWLTQKPNTMRNRTLLFSILLLAACGKGDDDTPAPPPSTPAVSVKDDAFTGYFRRTDGGWVAGDGGYSVRLPDGRTLWVWGDSHIGNYDAATGTVPCLFQVNNAGLVQSASDPAQMQTLTGPGSPASLFQHPGGWPEYWFWPGAGFQHGDTVYVVLENIKRKSGGGSFGFESGGPAYLGKLRYPAMQPAGVQPLPAQAGVQYSIGFVPGGGDTLYAFGKKGDGFLGSKAYVARLSAASPTTAWSYYNGTTWSTDPAAAAPVFSDGETSISSVFKAGNKYVGLSTAFSLDCKGKGIYAFTADAPTGPWNGKKLVYEITDTLDGKYPFFYIAVGHPEATDSRGVLVTYCVNGFLDCGPETCIDNRKNPDWYRPKAFRLPLNLIGAQ